MPRFVYCARLTKQGGTVVDLVEVDPKDLPTGVPTYASKREAKEASEDPRRGAVEVLVVRRDPWPPTCSDSAGRPAQTSTLG